MCDVDCGGAGPATSSASTASSSSTASGLSGSGGAGAGGEGGRPECVEHVDCPGVDNGCQHHWCIGGTCKAINEPEGTELPDPVPGDCKGAVCDDMGNAVEVLVGNDDPPGDGNECTLDYCSASGMPMHTALNAGTPCTGGVCDGMGNCE